MRAEKIVRVQAPEVEETEAVSEREEEGARWCEIRETKIPALSSSNTRTCTEERSETKPHDALPAPDSPSSLLKTACSSTTSMVRSATSSSRANTETR
jgi:hypothetical protein